MALGEQLPEHIAVLSGFCQFVFGLDVCCVSSCRICYCGTWISWLDLPDLVEKLDLMLCITATRELPLQLFILLASQLRDPHSSDAPFELLYQLHCCDTTAQQAANLYPSYALSLNKQPQCFISSVNCPFKSSSPTELPRATLVYFSLDR